MYIYLLRLLCTRSPVFSWRFLPSVVSPLFCVRRVFRVWDLITWHWAASFVIRSLCFTSVVHHVLWPVPRCHASHLLWVCSLVGVVSGRECIHSASWIPLSDTWPSGWLRRHLWWRDCLCNDHRPRGRCKILKMGFVGESGDGSLPLGSVGKTQ